MFLFDKARDTHAMRSMAGFKIVIPSRDIHFMYMSIKATRFVYTILYVLTEVLGKG